uniref:F-box domain-containing protein n=1 Tax=Oryza punctata TaxID=4537 RepID=A0A0E0M5G4_ORYPU
MREATAGHSSAAAPPSAAESAPDDVLAEILLRFPPHPSFLSRASLVCKRWRRLARDPGFLRRLRAFHRTPTVLGFFHNSPDLPRFVPAEGPPGRIAAEAASLRRDGDDGMWWFVDCRHGRALLRSRDWAELLVWDPMTGERRCITVPNQMQVGAFDRNAAVVSAASGGGDQDCHSSPFHVVVVFTTGHGRVFSCVYSSRIDAWGDLISTPVTSPCELYEEPPVLVGEALYWLLDGSRILEFEFGNQYLALIEHPVENHAIRKWNIHLVRMEDDVLGLAFVKDFGLYLWAREVVDDGASKWIPRRSVDNVLPPAMTMEGNRSCVMPIWICGFAQDGNVVFIRTAAGVFMVWLDTLKFKKVSDSLFMKTVYSYASFYVPKGAALIRGIPKYREDSIELPPSLSIHSTHPWPRSSSSAAESLPDDVVAEIILRLPPHPSFLSGASLRHLIRSPTFLRRVRAFHRTPHVLGFFHNSSDVDRFLPATESTPGRVAAEASSVGRYGDDAVWWFLDCRHGRALLHSPDRAHFLVWDPMTGERRRIVVPYKMQAISRATHRYATVFCAAASGGGDDDEGCHSHSSSFHFIVVFISRGHVFASVYSSRVGEWGDIISRQAPFKFELYDAPPAFIGESLYFLVNRNSMLEFQCGSGTQVLSLIKWPLEMNTLRQSNIRIVRLEGDVLGVVSIKDRDFSLHLWAREVADNGALKWIPRMDIEFDKLLPLPTEMMEGDQCRVMPVSLCGFSQDENVVFIQTIDGIFLVWLETLQFKKVSCSLLMKHVYPYASFYVPKDLTMADVTGGHSSPPAAAAAETLPDDVLAEILLRLPPHPSFLSSASLVSKRWFRHTHNPSFLRRFREFHRTAPVLGFFLNSSHGALFFPTEAPPGRIADQVASLRRNSGDGTVGMWWLVGCRHGRVLLRSSDWADLLVWDPMTEELVCFPAPIQMLEADADRDAAVFCAASGGDGDEDRRSGAFNVAVVFVSGDHVFGCVFSSAIGAWGDVISTPVTLPLLMIYDEPAALAGEALYWIVNGSSLLEFNFGSQSLALITRPSDMSATHRWNVRPVSLEDDLLGLAFFNDFCLHLWVREVADDGAPNWVPCKSFEMDKILSLPVALPVATEDSRRSMVPAWICGFSGDGNVVFIGTPAGIFLVELDTLKFKKVSDDTVLIKTIHPYESFYYVPNEKGGKQETAVVGDQVAEAGGKDINNSKELDCPRGQT